MAKSSISCNDIAPVNPADYPVWYSDILMDRLLFDKKVPAWLVTILVFLFYWGIPFIYSFLANTILTQSTECPDVPFSACDLVIKSQILYFGDKAYLQDNTHLIFAITIAVGAGLATHVLRSFHLTVIELRNAKISLGEETDSVNLYQRYRAIANHWGFEVFSLCLAVMVCIIFFKLSSLDTNKHWWGYKNYGNAGFVLALIEGVMVYEGSKVITSLGVGSLMLSRFIRHPLQLRPFHPDGCNGLAPLGHQIFFLWLFALTLIFSIYVTLKFGYLGVEKTIAVWIIAIFGTLAIPALAIFPLIASMLSVQNARLNRMSGLEDMLENLLVKTLDAVKQGRCEDAVATEEQMNKIKSIQDVFHSVNIWPFNPKMLVGIFLVNVIQVILTTDEIIKLFH